MVRVVLVDDQQLVRAGLRLILSPEPDLEVVGEASDGVESIAVVRTTRPDVVIMDVRMPRMDGIEATRRLVALPEPPRVLVVTTFDLDEYVYAALRAGASGFLLKDAPEEQLVGAVRTVQAGVSLLSPEITRRLVETGARRAERSTELGASLEATLTARERDVLRLVAEGLSNREIAGRLYVAEATVKTHVNRLLGKLGLSSRVQAVVLAYEAGLVPIGGSGTVEP